MPIPPLRLRSPVGNNLRNDPDDVHDLALSLEGAGGPPASDAAKLGIWDHATRDGVIEFQKRNALKVDGALLPGGQSEQSINIMLANKLARSGSGGSTLFEDLSAVSDRGRAAPRALDSQAPVDGINDLGPTSGKPVGPPDSHVHDVSALFRDVHQPSIQKQPRPDRGGVVLVADENRGRRPSPKRTPSARSGSILTQPPFGLPRWAARAATRAYHWSNEPIPELVDLKRRTLGNIDGALEGISKPGKHGVLGRISNRIAASRLRLARSYTDALVPTTKGELAMLGISVVGTIASAGNTMMVLRRGKKVFLADPKETKLLPPPRPAKATVKTHLHHVFPQKYERFFEKRGIHIHLSTVRLPADKHLKWLHGGRDRWLADWKKWIDENSDASINDVYNFAGKMIHKYDIDNITLEVYWPKHGKRFSRSLGHEPPK